MRKMLNEKTAVFTDMALVINGQTLFLGVVFEPVIDFAQRTFSKSIREYRAYRYEEDRFHFAGKIPTSLIAMLFSDRTGFLL